MTAALPSGTVTRAAWEQMREHLLADLRAALPVDVVLLGLYGAMVAEGEDDCEGDLLQRVRDIVGPEVVVGAEFDPHHHLSKRMVHCADVLVAFKEYPHTDALERGLELVDLCVACAQQRIRPVAAVADTGMIAPIHTTREPGRAFVQRIQALEGRNGVLSISITHGFAWGDVPDLGTKVLVYTDGNEALAQRLARELAQDLYAQREAFGRPYPGIDEALDQALASPPGTVVLADSADNAGGGAASDSTFVLRRLLQRGIGQVALWPMWDPMAVRLAGEAGVGAQLTLRIGGKVSAMSGDPVDLPCTVRAWVPGMHSGGLSGSRQFMGDCALVEAGPPDQGIAIVLASLRHQAIDTDLFTQLGVDLSLRRLVVVKSSQHFYASFSRIASQVIYVDAPGSVTQDLRSLPYTKVPRPRWPL